VVQPSHFTDEKNSEITNTIINVIELVSGTKDKNIFPVL
jgi:hypothetical protein